jgi:hypothetical protein
LTETKISFDDRQITEIREALKHPSQPFWQSESLLRLVQALALVVGGCWVLIQFILYQRDEIQLKQDELRQSIRIKEMEVKLDELKRSRATHELASLTTYRFSVDRKIKVKRIAGGDPKNPIYEVNYSVSLKNVSDEQFEASLWVLDYFIGLPDQEVKKSPVVMKPVGTPSGRWNPSGGTDGSIRWKPVGSMGAVFAAAEGKIAEPWASAARQDVELKSGGGLTGTLKRDQSYDYSEDYLVKAPSGSYVALVASFCFNRCNTNDDLYTTRDYAQLPDETEDEKDAKPRNRGRHSK